MIKSLSVFVPHTMHSMHAATYSAQATAASWKRLKIGALLARDENTQSIDDRAHANSSAEVAMTGGEGRCA